MVRSGNFSMREGSCILSIVTTLYNSSFYIDEFYQRITKEAQKITDNYEIIFVDDGSPDDSLKKAIDLCQKDEKVKVIELSRNFGHHKAIMTGLSYAEGDYVFLIDSDLEEEPELLGKFWEEIQKEKDIDVVYGVQERRKGNWFEKISGELFYYAFNKIANINIPKNLTTCRIMKKKYVKSLILHKERENFLAGLFEITGFKQKPLAIKKLYRGKTNYSLPLKIYLFVNAVTSFSIFPLKVIFLIGIIISAVSFFFIVWVIYRKFYCGVEVSGWASIMVSVWFLGGMIILSIGIIGIYISKIFAEVKQRPYTIVRNVYTKKQE